MNKKQTAAIESNEPKSLRLQAKHLGKIITGVASGYIAPFEFTDREVGEIRVYGNDERGYFADVRPYGFESAKAELQKSREELFETIHELKRIEPQIQSNIEGRNNVLTLLVPADQKQTAANEFQAKIDELANKAASLAAKRDELNEKIEKNQAELETGKFAIIRYQLDHDAIRELKLEVPVLGTL